MIKGMTGFGSAQAVDKKVKAVVEIKSLNHRYLDILFYLPIGFAALEDKIRQMVQKEIKRGRITISVKITEKPGQQVALNKETVKQYIKYARVMKKEFGLKEDLSVSDVMRMPGVFESKDLLVRPETFWPVLQKSIGKSLQGLVVMRKREGRSLLADVTMNLKRMSLQINKIKKRAQAILKGKKKSLTVEEFKSFQKNVDIHEEISRMTHHIDELKLLLKSTAAVGKRIDFIAQEMQRETNTMGSKLQDSVITTAVISLKSKIEKIREQAQNIE